VLSRLPRNMGDMRLYTFFSKPGRREAHTAPASQRVGTLGQQKKRLRRLPHRHHRRATSRPSRLGLPCRHHPNTLSPPLPSQSRGMPAEQWRIGLYRHSDLALESTTWASLAFKIPQMQKWTLSLSTAYKVTQRTRGHTPPKLQQ